MKIEWTLEKKEAVIKKLEEWLVKHDASCGEVIYQSDDCNIDAVELLADLVDNVVKPVTEDEDYE